MIYKIEKRCEFGGGSMTSHYEVISYTHRSNIGILMNGKTLKNGTKEQCQKYCGKYNIQIEEDILEEDIIRRQNDG